MRNKKLKRIFILSILLILLFMMLNMYISYLSIKDSAKKSIANQNLQLAKALASSLDVETYKRFLENPVENQEYMDIKRYLEHAREKNGALHVYTLVVDNPKVSRVMIAGLPDDIKEQNHIGEVCTVPEEQVARAYKGHTFVTDIIADPLYGNYLSVGVPITNQADGVIGYLAIDVGAEAINDISVKVLKSSIASLIFDGLYVIILLVFFVIFQRWYQKELKKEIGDTEETYHSELHSLIASVRSLRHDFSNHIQVLHGLLKLEKQEKALEYLTGLSKEIHSIESITLDVSNPGLSVLLETKRLSAQNNNIDISFDVSPDPFHMVKTTDLIKLLSNLIDNAIEATIELPERERKIDIVCKVVIGNYIFEVRNSGAMIKEKDQAHIFKCGFSTKKPVRGKVRGQGLFIVKELVSRYGGVITIHSFESETAAIVNIPIEGALPLNPK